MRRNGDQKSPQKVATALQDNAEPQWKERYDKVNKLENTLALSHYRIGQERTLVRDWVDERSRSGGDRRTESLLSYNVT